MRLYRTITLYSSTANKFNTIAREYLLKKGVFFDEINLDKNPDIARDLVSRTNRNETPVLEVDGRLVVGYQPDIYDILFREDDNKKKNDEEKFDLYN